ncbi:hypothetical protein DEAB109302_05150 [Dermacoccus abyssi]
MSPNRGGPEILAGKLFSDPTIEKLDVLPSKLPA